MKVLTHISSKYFWLIFAVLLAAIILGCKCSISKVASDPLASWHNLDFVSDNVPKAIQADYEAYIRQHDMGGYVGTIHFFENGTGQHAIEFEAFEHNINASWCYALIYDEQNKRINVIRYRYVRYQS